MGGGFLAWYLHFIETSTPVLEHMGLMLAVLVAFITAGIQIKKYRSIKWKI